MKEYYDFEEYESYYKSRDKKGDRVILHSDLNNFFASVESLKDATLKYVPLAVCGDAELRHGIVLAKNEEAKKYNIKTGDTISEAKRKCANLVITRTHYKEYLKYSKIVNEIYLSYATRVEPFGIDESWIDISEISHRRSRGDAFSEGKRIAEEIRERVKRETGLTVSVGVSFNKTFSKFASDLKKPDAVSAISYEDFQNVVWNFPVSELLFVGGRTRDALNKLKITTIGDVALRPRRFFREKFGKSGELLWDTANGYDLSPVKFYHGYDGSKSISNSVTMPTDVTDFDSASSVIISLTDAVGEELRRRHKKCSTVKIYLKYSDFSHLTRQIKLNNSTFDTSRIYKEATCLFKKNADWSRGVRSIGVGVDDLTSSEDLQTALSEDEGDSALDLAIDTLRTKYGDSVICKGSVLKYSTLCNFDKKHPAFNHNIR